MAHSPKRGWLGVGTAARTHALPTPTPPFPVSLSLLHYPFPCLLSSFPRLSINPPFSQTPFPVRLSAPPQLFPCLPLPLPLLWLCPLPSSLCPPPLSLSLSCSCSCLFCGLFSCRCHGDVMQTVQPPVCSAHVRSVCVCAADKSLRGSVYRIM